MEIMLIIKMRIYFLEHRFIRPVPARENSIVTTVIADCDSLLLC